MLFYVRVKMYTKVIEIVNYVYSMYAYIIYLTQSNIKKNIDSFYTGS